MKKLLSLVLLVVLVASLFVGCTEEKAETAPVNEEKETTSTETEKKDKIVLGFASNSYSDKWQTYLNDAVQKKCDELGVEVVFSDGKGDPATQLANVENFIVEGVDAILIVMVDPSAPKPFITACENAGIPLIAVNRKFEGANVFVGSDDINAGNIQMEYVAEALAEKGNVVILEGMPGHNSAVKRTEGNTMILDNYPDMQLIFKDTGKWDRAKGMEITENWLQSGEEINAIIANNDEMAIGAIRALEAIGKNDEVIVAGVDATPDALEYVKNGTLEVTVFQSPFGQGGTGVEAAMDLINGVKVPEYVDVPFEKVTIDNVDEYIKIWE
ncbi:sugar ABC transporter substrate-binding protein [Vallitalea okinawensis]|uniref:sugar ABC transporter substrate-binding protein n=1 Tax=Vallitalea okinawensis TaxID=2078660 RepID=UPI000CFC4F68|nr:sugar ABC transporter substrate-binding protein [Vallitalea okinawensis]